MKTNADITLLIRHTENHEDQWIPVQIKGVFWFGRVKVSVGENGLNSADVYTARIPISSAPEGRQYIESAGWAKLPTDQTGAFWTLQNGDYVVKGLIESGAPTQLQKAGAELFKIVSHTDNRRGSPLLQHWRIEGA